MPKLKSLVYDTWIMKEIMNIAEEVDAESIELTGQPDDRLFFVKMTFHLSVSEMSIMPAIFKRSSVEKEKNGTKLTITPTVVEIYGSGMAKLHLTVKVE